MRLSTNEIELARRMRDAGLAWEPAVGHFVYDEAGLIEVESPFQPRVYFILDMKHFLRRAETVARLKEAMFWLPQWDQTRALLRERGVGNETIARHLQETRAIEDGRELIVLYERLLAALS